MVFWVAWVLEVCEIVRFAFFVVVLMLSPVRVVVGPSFLSLVHSLEMILRKRWKKSTLIDPNEMNWLRLALHNEASREPLPRAGTAHFT